MSEKQDFKNISIVGAGAWGTALAEVMSRRGHQINLWAKENSVVNSINSKHENDVFLPNVKLSNLIVAFNNLEQITKCDLLLVVSPAQHTRETLLEVSKTLKSETPIILCSKGIEISTLSLMSQVTESIFPKNPIAILSGPSFAIDVVNNKATAVTLACKDLEIAKSIAENISLPTFRPYFSEDVIGAQIGGAT